MLLHPISRRPRSLLTAQCHTCHFFFTICNKVHQISTIRHISQVASPNISLRLMPLGGSVTYGVRSSDGNGYRKFLQDMLLAQGYQVRLVGSRKSGSMENNDNEGWRGYRLDQISTKARNSVATLSPDVFTINAGSNDCLQDYQIDTFGERMGNTLEYLWQASPLSTIILSTLLINADKQVNSRVVRVNSQIRDLVESKATEEKRIVLADMYSAPGPELHDLVDGTHPHDAGYRKMAEIWFDAIQQARRNKLFEK
ncbi:SGNH hydrolase-type esterase domain-containing protein [Fusarium tricinctum]|uniref:SGNH hydrolase-type esterase domain-containing protein n=1 Tax=Fusarium tricinctum TaxID=61284 RepID=A0A8K0RZ57_9HYPO|nr:SGNH hydrolase-type esterase domain-containing protein [Fusarium tricinctum]